MSGVVTLRYEQHDMWSRREGIEPLRTIEVCTSEETLTEVLESVEAFLKAIGYSLDGRLEIVEEDETPEPDEEDSHWNSKDPLDHDTEWSDSDEP